METKTHETLEPVVISTDVLPREDEAKVIKDDDTPDVKGGGVNAAPGGLGVDAAGATIGLGHLDKSRGRNAQISNVTGDVVIGDVKKEAEKPVRNPARFDRAIAMPGPNATTQLEGGMER